jgi:large subunit ribosomal protein L31
MKVDIHPKYNKMVVQFPQGDSFETRSTSTIGTLMVDVDYRKHPAWTKSGIAGASDTSAKVTRFKEKVAGFDFSIKKK